MGKAAVATIKLWQKTVLGSMAAVAVYSGFLYQLQGETQKSKVQAASRLQDEHTRLALEKTIQLETNDLRILERNLSRVTAHTRAVRLNLHTVDAEIRKLRSGIAVAMARVNTPVAPSGGSMTVSIPVVQTVSAPAVQSVSKASGAPTGP